MKPSTTDSGAGDETTIRDIAASWVVRRDRSLSPAEAAELKTWLAADPRHAVALAQSAESWRMFRGIGLAVRRTPAAAPASQSRRTWVALGGLAAAAAVALGFVVFERAPRPAPAGLVAATTAANLPPAPTTRRFADGSVARLNDGAEIVEAFSATERRIRLVRGEAFFTVVKNAARPFLVEVGHVTVRAVGTAFAVRFEARAIDVLVTEGTVQVTPPPQSLAAQNRVDLPVVPIMVDAGHLAVVATAPEPQTPAIVVSPVSPAEIARTLAWNEPMLELAGATLGELVTAYAQRSGRRIEIDDPALGAVRIGGQFPPNDVDGFIRALDEIYDVKSERRADGSIVLRKRRF